MGQSLDGLGELLKMPYGCGEQNMVYFAPDVYILKYLNATGQTAGSIVTKAKRFLNAGIVDPRTVFLLLKYSCIFSIF